MSKSQSAFARAIAQPKKETLRRHHASELRLVYFKHPAIKEVFNKIPVKLRPDAWISDAVSSDIVTIGLSMRDLEGFKDKRLTRALEPFTDSAWTCGTTDWTYGLPNRDFRFTKRVQLTLEMRDQIERHTSARWLRNNGEHHLIPVGFSIQMLVSAYVKSDSETCRIVVKGITERVVQEEVKEIVCD